MLTLIKEMKKIKKYIIIVSIIIVLILVSIIGTILYIKNKELQEQEKMQEEYESHIGDITEEKLDILKEADYIFRDEISKNNLDKSLSQYFAVLTDTRSVGVMGDERTYDYMVALRAVITDDFMTAKFAKIPYEILDKISKRIVNEVEHVNRIVYDITSKPPATIEWE